MKNRPGEHARQTIRQTWLDTVKQHVSVWMVLIGAVTIYVVLIALLPMSSTVRAFWIGFAIATAISGFVGMVYVLSNTYGWNMGKLGEEATADALSGFRQRRSGWRIVNGLLFAGHGNVDHVLVGPGGVFAIESKWTSRPCRIEEGRVVGPMGREPVSQARDGARKVGRMLRHGPQHFDVSVRPVVVLWGSGAPHLDHGWVVVDGVLVCEGRCEESWLPQLNVAVLDQPTVERITDFLEDQLSRQVDKSVLAKSR